MVRAAFRQAFGGLHHAFAALQPVLNIPAGQLLLCNVDGRAEPGRPPLKENQLVAQNKAAAAVFVHMVAHQKTIRIQLTPGTEGTGTVSPLQNLVASLAAVIPCTKEPLTCGVDIIELIRLRIADVKNVFLRVQDRLGQIARRQFRQGHLVVVVEQAAEAVLLLQPGLIRRRILFQIAGRKIDGADGTGEEKPLQQPRTQLLQSCQFLGGFDALAADANAAAFSKLQHITEKPIVVGTFMDIPDETAVNLHFLDFHFLQSLQAGIAGAEVVDGNGDALLFPLGKNRIDVRGIQQLDALGQLQRQGAARQAAVLDTLEHLIGDVGITELHMGHVDAHGKIGYVSPPDAALLQGCGKHPQTHLADQPHFLQQRDEIRRADGAKAGRIVTQQRFRAMEGVGMGDHLRLIENGKSFKAVVHTPLQVLFQLQSGQFPLVILGGKEPEHLFAMGFGAVHGGLGILIQNALIGDPVGLVRDTAAGQGTLIPQPDLQLFKDLPDFAAAAARQVDGEGIAIHAVDPLGAAGGGLQRIGHLLQQLIAVGLAVFEVDGLLVVHVQHQQESVLAAFQQLLDLLLQHIHMECAGEVVGLAVGGQNGQTAHHPLGLAAAAEVHLAAEVDPEQAAGAVHYPVFGVIVGGDAGEGVYQSLLQPCEILRPYNAEPFG